MHLAQAFGRRRQRVQQRGRRSRRSWPRQLRDATDAWSVCSIALPHCRVVCALPHCRVVCALLRCHIAALPHCPARQFEHHIEQFAQGESDDEEAPGFDDAESADLEHDVRLDPTVGHVVRTFRGSCVDIRLAVGGAPLGRLTLWGSSFAMQCKIAAHTRCSRALNCKVVPDCDGALVQWLLDGLTPGMTSAEHLPLPSANMLTNVARRMSCVWHVITCTQHQNNYIARSTTHVITYTQQQQQQRSTAHVLCIPMTNTTTSVVRRRSESGGPDAPDIWGYPSPWESTVAAIGPCSNSVAHLRPPAPCPISPFGI
jgi:hypothetical protein